MAKGQPHWRLGDDDAYRTILQQNPWANTGEVPRVLARERERPLGQLLWRRLLGGGLRRFQLILGPRRVGKTTVMYQTVRHLLNHGIPAKRLWWLRLDHPLLMRRELGGMIDVLCEVSSASPEAPVFLFLDELTYARDWDLWLKTFYDEQRPVRIVGTSSATAVIRDRLQESGVGRWEEQYLGPYTFNEYLHLVGRDLELPRGRSFHDIVSSAIENPPVLGKIDSERRRYMFTGGFPELLLALQEVDFDDESTLLESQRTLRVDAIERAIYKDIPQAYGVDRPILLERLLYVLAEQVCGILSPTRICGELDGMSAPTFEKYLSYLERAFLVFTLTNYSGSERSKQKRGRKLYFTDGAARNAALQRGLAPIDDPLEMALLLENLIAGHLHAMTRQGVGQLHHWRDGDAEVDLVLEERGRLIAFEIASSSRHHRSGLRALRSRFERRMSGAYLVAPGQPPIAATRSDDGIGTLPLDLLVLLAGDSAECHLRDRLNVPIK